MKRIYLVRHCKAEGQDERAKLTDLGKEQAEQLADFFSNRNIDFIVSSPFERAISTIRPFAEKFGLEIHSDGRLSERVLSAKDLPDWMDRLRVSFDELDRKLEGGESSREAMSRGIEVIHALFSKNERNIVVVTHGNLMALIIKYFDARFGFDRWRELTNPDVFELSSTDAEKEIIINRLWK